jgi:hypothetical protein
VTRRITAHEAGLRMHEWRAATYDLMVLRRDAPLGARWGAYFRRP